MNLQKVGNKLHLHHLTVKISPDLPLKMHLDRKKKDLPSYQIVP